MSAHGLTGGGGSRRVVEKALAAFQAADPALRVTDGNVSMPSSAPRAAAVPAAPVVRRTEDSGQEREHVRCSQCSALNYVSGRDAPCYACGSTLNGSDSHSSNG